ncbi:hypothetical protein SAY87_013339 [Trapa incisa]|uniref:CASP-like protein n=1 Tax=Trapa incisa TaxID=236973 RepID=A0AAN7KBR3_9MYRT|nr:hypothetical protein SAY87_013339 [Trapa incisa]
MMKSGPAEGGQLTQDDPRDHKANWGISISDLVMRAFAALGTLTSAVVMGTTDQTLQNVGQFFLFRRARYNDLPTFTFFLTTNAIVCCYLTLSLGLSISQVIRIIRSTVKITRIILVILDTVMLALFMAGASAATAIVYLAHKGNAKANWLPICQQYNSFCERISGSLVGSYFATIALVILITLSTIAISRC